jgi:hypothetical protein
MQQQIRFAEAPDGVRIAYASAGRGPPVVRAEEDNQWLAHGVPHVMAIVSDSRLLASLPTDPHHGGPWVMWKDTPYAHIMIPAVARVK